MAAGKGASEATFRLNVEGNAAQATRDVAASARLAAKSIETYEGEIKTLSADLRRLRGNSDDVVATKKAIKAQIERARVSVSGLTVELAKQGKTYGEVSKAAKGYGEGLRGGFAKAKDLAKGAGLDFAKALAPAVGPLRAQIAKTTAPAAKALAGMLTKASAAAGRKLAPAGKALGKALASPVVQGTGKALQAVGAVAKPMASATLPALRAAALGAGAAVAAVGVAAVAAAGAVAAFGLASASAYQKAERHREALLGSSKDARAFSDQIAVLAGKVPMGTAELDGLASSLSKTRLSGRAMVDTMNAVAQVSGAVDATAGAKIQELITRSHRSGRMALGRLELEGAGVDFDAVAKEYAAGTKKSLAAARAELAWGKAPLEAGAEALRKAAEKKFGKLNLDNAFSLDDAPKKFADQFRYLAKDIDLEPLTKGLREAFAQLSPEQPLGRAVKTFFDTFGSAIADVAGKSIPLMLDGFKWLMVGALRVGTFFYETKKKIKDAFSAEGFVGLGKEVVAGLVRGLTGQNNFLTDAGKGLGASIKRAFSDELEIRSPSKVFERYGENTVEGFAQGVDGSAASASGAVRDMVGAPPASAPASAPAVASVGELHVHIHGLASMADATEPSGLAKITAAVREALAGQGVAA